jgi:hypothetical protein
VVIEQEPIEQRLSLALIELLKASKAIVYSDPDLLSEAALEKLESAVIEAEKVLKGQ